MEINKINTAGQGSNPLPTSANVLLVLQAVMSLLHKTLNEGVELQAATGSALSDSTEAISQKVAADWQVIANQTGQMIHTQQDMQTLQGWATALGVIALVFGIVATAFSGGLLAPVAGIVSGAAGAAGGAVGIAEGAFGTQVAQMQGTIAPMMGEITTATANQQNWQVIAKWISDQLAGTTQGISSMAGSVTGAIQSINSGLSAAAQMTR